MSQAEKLAKTARENLAAALNALQTSDDAPTELLEVADIIAQCMGVLHRIERTQGADLTGKEVALASVRKALDYLQGLEINHPTLDLVLEKVAGSLASVHGLSRLQASTAAQPAAPQPAAPPAAAPQPVAPAPQPVAPAPSAIPAPVSPYGTPPPAAPQEVFSQPVVPVGAQPTQSPASLQAASAPSGSVRPGNTAQMPSPAAPQPAAQPAPQAAAPIHPGMATQVMSPSSASQNAFPPPQAYAQPAAPAAQFQQSPPTQPFVAPVQQRGFAPAIQAGFQQPPQAASGFAEAQQQAQQQAAPLPSNVVAMQAQNAAQARQETTRTASPVYSQPAPAAGAGSESGNVVVELGTHSVSNFYKGLAGNDVIEHGGLFVATYRIPKIGTNVKLRVLLPGDLEFIATGVVQWMRDPHSGGESSEPGFGARLTQISPEGRQLVYRYTRNREPMFYDDL